MCPKPGRREASSRQCVCSWDWSPTCPLDAFTFDPALPPWCPELNVQNVRIGNQRLAIGAWRHSDGSCDVNVIGDHSAIDVVHGRPPWLEFPTS
jgi:hypothetical protein